MKTMILSALIVLLSCQNLAPNHQPLFIIWSVGQGQWLTWSESQFCLHLDMGGEFINWSKLRTECRGKKNFAIFSHADWDHIRFANRAKMHLSHLCRLNFPREKINSSKRKFLQRLPVCQDHVPRQLLKELEFVPPHRLEDSSNDMSFVFILNHQILIPGDSSTRAEKYWAYMLNPSKIKVLILGHHGSRTSTSNRLLSHLPELVLAVASARKKRYGHPHHQTRKRILKRGIPLLTTEVWGNIYFTFNL